MLIRTMYWRLTRQQEGGSLPGVLIAIAVGAILMGAFLSHVSSRMLATQAAEGSAKELYAADSGVEYAIWALMNDIDNVRTDANVDVGTAITVDPINVNDNTVTIQVTALPRGAWTQKRNISCSVSSGAALAFLDPDIYALCGGGSSSFLRYSISSDSWSSPANQPDRPAGSGGAMLEHDGDLYAFLSQSFQIYDGSWSEREAVGNSIGQGSALADGGNQIYALLGDSPDFYWYNPNSRKWNKSSKDTPASVGPGGSLARASNNEFYAFRGDSTRDFWRFKGNKWDNAADAPGSVGPGGSLAGDLDSNGYIYGLLGNGTGEFWRFDLDNGIWEELATIPVSVDSGGSLAYAGGTDFYALQGNGTSGFWHFRITPPRYDIEVSTGSTDLVARVEIGYSFDSGTIIYWDFQ